jgi:hypothetical protein
LAIEGQGEPGGARHLDAIDRLLAVAVELGRISSRHGIAITIPPLEGLWWVDGERPALEVPRQEWRWRPLLPVPEAVDEGWVSQAGTVVGGRAAVEAELDRLEEGRCLQALHIGPYEKEPETLATMDAEMARRRLSMNGRHHEIYLSDLSGPLEKARTILRHPVKRD